MEPSAIVEAMDALRIDMMAIDLAPFQMGYALDAPTGISIAKVANEAIADAVDRYPDRFVGLGTLPMQDVAAAVAELERLMADRRMKGVQLLSNVRGAYLGDERFRPVWQAIADLGAAVFVHPGNMIGTDRLGEYFLANLIGNPVETARSIADVIFSGLLDELPDLRICFAHGGGAASSMIGRWDRGHAVRPQAKGRIERAPSDYFRMLYFDHITHSPRVLRFLVDLVGAGHVMLGTDYPFDMGPDAPVDDVEHGDGFSDEEKRQIISETAHRFLRIER
jgi:aminocarboxymuconate-semialdehyde decarboxylase